MQDFQEVIEDSQLINAMYDDTPKPVEAWFSASLEEVEMYSSHLSNYSPEELTLPFICNNSLGFYLFTKYLRMNEAAVFAHFLVDCARFRSAPASKRQRQASEILSKYLVEGNINTDHRASSSSSSGRSSSSNSSGAIGGTFPVSLTRNRPLPSSQPAKTPAPDTDIDTDRDMDTESESDSSDRKVDTTSAPSSTSTASASVSVSREWEVASSATPANALGLTGPLLDALKTAIQQLTTPPPPSLLDEIDDVVLSLTTHQFDSFKDSLLYKKYVNIQIQLQKPVAYKDFQLFRTLGRGGFGLVNGCKKTQSGQLYAMKALCRKRIKLKKAADLCLNEKSILQLIRSPFIVCMQYAFTTPQDVFLVLDLMVGGDLGFYLHRTVTGAFSAAEAKYFVARTVLGLKALHDARVVYRDLKPENILMDSKGRTKISDLGLACVVPEKRGLSGTYGTRGYWAPEMLRRDKDGHRLRYGCEVDWFSLGCVTYEFLVGCCPFKTDKARRWSAQGGKEAAGVSSAMVGGGSTINTNTTNTNTNTSKSTKSTVTKSKARSELEERIDAAVLEMEPDFSSPRLDAHSISFCKALLAKDPGARLGSGRHGAEQVMQHPYFDDMSWDDVISGEMTPPTQPRRDLNMATQDEIGTFSDAKLARKVEVTEADMAVFAQWDYVRPEALYDEAVRFMSYEEEHGKIVVKDNSGFCCSVS